MKTPLYVLLLLLAVEARAQYIQDTVVTDIAEPFGVVCRPVGGAS